MSTRSARKYTSAERREAVSLAEEVGPLEASRRPGIPVGTVTYWRYASRKAAAAGHEWPELPAASSDEDASDAELAEALAPKDIGSKPVARLYTPSERARALELVADKGSAKQLWNGFIAHLRRGREAPPSRASSCRPWRRWPSCRCWSGPTHRRWSWSARRR